MKWESAFSTHMENFLLHKKALGYSGISYIWHLRDFDRFCAEQFPSETVLTKEIVIRYTYAKDGELINSRNRRVATIRELARYLHSLGISAYLLPPKMTPAQTRYTPHIFTDNELSAFFLATDQFECRTSDILAQYSVAVIFRLLYSCGLRPGEVLRIRCEDIDLSTGQLYIRESKRHKDRIVMLSEDMLRLCNKYDVLCRKYLDDKIWFFSRSNGQSYNIQWLGYQFHKAWQNAALTTFSAPKPRVYDFRHTFATRKLYEWMDAGVDLYQRLPYLSAYMGHSDFSTTAYYIHLLPQRLAANTTINWESFANLLPEVSP